MLTMNENYGGTIPSKKYAAHEVHEGGALGNELGAGVTVFQVVLYSIMLASLRYPYIQ